MRDEVLQKVLTEDTSVIPRYDVILPDGTIIAENIQLVLKNNILTEGTSLNKYTLLKDTTAVMYGLDGPSALPDDVLMTIRTSSGYCPKLKIYSTPNATVTLQGVSDTTKTITYTIPASGALNIDITKYDTYKLQGIIGGVYTTPRYIDIYENGQYSINVFNYVTYAKFTVTEEVGATVSAIHTDGSVSTGVVGADKTCTIALYKQGTWNCTCIYSGVYSQTIAIEATSATNGTTINKTPAWTKVVVQVTSGATVTLSKSGVSMSAISVNGSCTFWMPDTDTWSAFASLGDKRVSGMATPTLYGTKTISLTLN